MPRKKQNDRWRKALTLLEMVIALSIVSVLFAVILPVFTNAKNSWSSRQSASEAIQNGRVLVDYINRQLTQAVEIISVSNSSDDDGYIEFEDTTGTTLRFDIAANNYVQFGEIGTQSELAGPVTKLQFTCYALDDMDTPTTDAETIRFVKVEAALSNSSSPGKDKTFMTSAFLQANNETPVQTPFEFDTVFAKDPALAKIDDNHFLCAYEGDKDNGLAVILMVDSDTMKITRGSSFEFDGTKGEQPSLTQIDSTHYLCAYTNNAFDGWLVVLTVDPATWTISRETPLEFDSIQGKDTDLIQIDSTHFLCTYSGSGDDGWAFVATIDPVTWEITQGVRFEFDTAMGKDPVLKQIDSTHYLCVYSGVGENGWATVLEVDTGTWQVACGALYEFDAVNCNTPDLQKLDTTHYLCAYTGQDGDAWATVFEVDTATWTVSNGPATEFNDQGGATTSLAQIGSGSFLCVYERFDGPGTYDGWFNRLSVDTGTWSVAGDTPYEYEKDTAQDTTVIHMNKGNFLTAYSGPDNDGWAVVLKVGPEAVTP